MSEILELRIKTGERIHLEKGVGLNTVFAGLDYMNTLTSFGSLPAFRMSKNRCFKPENQLETFFKMAL